MLALMGARRSRVLGLLLCAAACGEAGPASLPSGGSGTGGSSGADAADGSDSTGALPELRCGPDPAGPTGWVDSISTVGTDLGGDDSVVYTGATLIAFGGRD